MKIITYLLITAILFCLHWHFTITPQEYARASVCRVAPPEIKDLMAYHGPYHDYTLYPDGGLVLHRGKDIILTGPPARNR